MFPLVHCGIGVYDVPMEMERAAVIAQRVKKLLNEPEKKSPAWLAYESGVTPGAISKLLNEKNPNVRSETLAKVAKALGTSVDFLQGNTDDPTPQGGEPWPEYALEVLESMRRLGSAQNYTLLVTARALINERESLHHLSVVDLVQMAADYYGGGEELKRFEDQLRLLEARRGITGGIATAAEEIQKPAQE